MGDRGVLRRGLAGWMLVMVLVLAAGCGGGEDRRPAKAATTRTTPGDAASRAKLLAVGERVFVRQCDFCHRLNGRRPARTPPPDAYGTSFEQVETSEAFVIERVTNGFGGMQSFSSELSPRKIRAVAMYVVANQGRDVDAPERSQQRLAAGERVFEARCQRCHSIADRTQTGDPAETDAGWDATDFRIVRPSVGFVTSVLDGTGNAFMIELMPEVQGKLSEREIRDVAAYVNALATPGTMVGSQRGAGERR